MYQNQIYFIQYIIVITNVQCTGTVQFRLSDEEVYSVEELIGMIFSHGKKQAEDFTDQKIKVALYVVHPFHKFLFSSFYFSYFFF